MTKIATTTNKEKPAVPVPFFPGREKGILQFNLIFSGIHCILITQQVLLFHESAIHLGKFTTNLPTGVLFGKTFFPNKVTYTGTGVRTD